MRAAVVLSLLLMPVRAVRLPAQTRARAPRPRRPPRRRTPAMMTEPAVLQCPSLLGEGVQTKRVVLRRADRPRSGRRHHHRAPAAHRTRDADLRPAQPAHLLRRAGEDQSRVPPLHRHDRRADRGQHAALARVVQNEFRTAADLLDRVGGGAGPGGVKAVAPTGVETITLDDSRRGASSVSILGEKLAVIRPDATAPTTSARPGRPDRHHQQRHARSTGRRRPAPRHGACADAGERPLRAAVDHRSRLQRGPHGSRGHRSAAVDRAADRARDPRRRRRVDRRDAGGAAAASRATVAASASSRRSGTAARAARSGAACERARGTIVAIQDADLELDPRAAGRAGGADRRAATPMSSTDRGSCTAQAGAPWSRWPRTGS